MLAVVGIGTQACGQEDEIKFADALPWRPLGTGTTLNWTTRVAGKFTLRAKSKVNGTWFYSGEKPATVQFPTRSQILSDAGIVSEMSALWQDSLMRSTSNEYWELGFPILLDTTDNQYEAGDLEEGGPAIPGDDVQIIWFSLPDDGDPLANATGNTYFVGLFHTHPPETYTPTNSLGRQTGPSTGSGGDIEEANQSDIPGFVYDYVVGNDWVYPGHPENSSADIYGYGPTKKETP